MTESVVIVSMGANTPVGANAWSSAAAVRAGVSGFTEHPYMIDTAGEPMKVALVSSIDIDISGVDRFEALLLPAIDEAIAPITQHLNSSLKIAIALALPEHRPGQPETLQRDLTARINARYSNQFSAFATFPVGHAAGLIGLQAACTKLSQGTLDACLLAGVDSYIEPATLEWLESNDQLHSAGPLNNAWGFIPGEAGAALLLMRESVAQSLRLHPFAKIIGTGVANESKRIKTETVCIGEGLTGAFRSALAPLPNGVKVSDVYCDMNGEPYRADEYGFTALRTKEFFDSASDFTAPADCWGDVSAAGSLLHLLLACAAGHKAYGSGRIAFTWASSEGGERAAALFTTATGI